MAANYTQEPSEEDASDLCFPKDKKSTSEYTMKTVRLFERFPALVSSPQHLDYGINYLISISSGQWYLYSATGKSIITGPATEAYRAVQEDPKPLSSYKEYPVGSSIHFEVTHLQAHPTQPGLVVLWGKHGIAVVHMPVASNGSSEELSASLVGEDLFVENVKLETVQVKWLPNSFSNVITVLHSDHQIRLYDVTSIGSCVLMTEVSVRPPGREKRDGGDILLTADAEIPIDFDFGPQLAKSKLVLIFVLQESGALYYILLRTLENIKKCYKEVHGPLRIHGEMDDKLIFGGSKHTSLVVTKHFPIVITTGDLSNTLQNFLLLPDEIDTDDVILEEKVLSGEMKLYLREKIILETVCETDNNYLQLIPDPHVDHRHAVVTETGIYLVNVNFITEVRIFVKNESNQKSEPLRSTPSSVQFLVCWKVSDKTQPDRCLAGLTFSDAVEQKLLIVLGDLRAVSVDVSCSYLPENSESQDKIPVSSNTGFAFGSSFQDILKNAKNMLKKGATQPLMCSSQDIKGEDLEKFTVEALDLLVREYIERHEEAMTYLECSINTLEVKTDTVSENLEELNQNRIDLRQTAELIAEMYDERSNKNEEYQKRLEATLHKQQQSLPAMTDQEKQWRKTLQDYQKDMEIFKTWIDALKEKVQLEKKENISKEEISTLKLSPHQISDIRNEIKRQHGDVEQLVRDIKELKNALGV